MSKVHISHPLDHARRRINAANHHVYRAGHMDTACEIQQALKDLKTATETLEQVQRDYPVANPANIDTSRPPTDPDLAPEEEQS
jgi:hypothetical protein